MSEKTGYRRHAILGIVSGEGEGHREKTDASGTSGYRPTALCALDTKGPGMTIGLGNTCPQ